MTIVGSQQYRYERVPYWPRTPKYFDLGQPSDAAINSAGDVFVVSRGDHPVTIWTAEGEFLGSWGEREFSAMPHGIYIPPDDSVWIVDRDYHVAMQFTPYGKLIRTLGSKLSLHQLAQGESYAPDPSTCRQTLRSRPVVTSSSLTATALIRFTDSTRKASCCFPGTAGVWPRRVRACPQCLDRQSRPSAYLRR